MAEKINPLTGQRQSGESNKAVLACNDYLRMGAGRSLRKLADKYGEQLANGVQKPPTTRVNTIFKWSENFGWVKRAEEYDSRMEAEKTRLAEEMMKSGLALDFERVGKLKELFELLFSELMEQGEGGVLHNLWLPDVKSIGSGEYAERVDIERYNSALISDIRGLLDDLAKETGGRVKKQEIGGMDGGVIKVRITDDRS